MHVLKRREGGGKEFLNVTDGENEKITWTYSVVIALEEGLGLIIMACITKIAATITSPCMNRPARKKKTPSIQVTNKINAVVNKILFIVAISHSIDKMVPVWPRH